MYILALIGQDHTVLTLGNSNVYILALMGNIHRGKLTATERTKASLMASLKMVGVKFIRISPLILSSQNAM